MYNSARFEGDFSWKDKRGGFSYSREYVDRKAILILGCLAVVLVGTTIIILEKCPNTRENINDWVLSFGERLKRQSGFYPRRKRGEESEDRQAA
ncbi:MAG: hypothetical protein OXN90_22970 [Gemmatimonadota bacterium]|nr:hypothetical protein [Gemmatimonadota bacterium]